MPHKSKVTTDHETIRAWAEERDGKPCRIKDTSQPADDLLQISFEDDPELEEITWDKFFDTFEEHRLAFLYQEETEDGEESRFCKFIYRDNDSGKGKSNKKKKKEEDDGSESEEDGDDIDDEDDEELEEDEGYDADDEEEDEM